MIVARYFNGMSRRKLHHTKLRAIVRNVNLPQLKRAAAERLLRTVDSVSIADFEEYCNGRATLKELGAAGVNVDALRKVKQTTKSDGTVTREVELFDRAGEELDRIMDRTIGKPAQAVQVSGGLQISEVRFAIPGLIPTDN